MSTNTRQPSKAGCIPYVPGNDYATSWSCSWTDSKFGALNPKELEVLEHVNCSYLSSGKPPTMLALKQHAQSLTSLIKKLSVSTSFGIVNGDADGDTMLRFNENEAFDWLNNLNEPYTNEDESHHWPLWALANHVKTEHEISGLHFHCPLEPARTFGSLAEKGSTVRPYRSHQNLAMHANECLEVLDHEYSTSGGLMSLLPTEASRDAEEMAGVRNTLLGQWLLWNQHLVARMHELEIDYAKALDLLAGEALVPRQKLNNDEHGGYPGPGVVPQDRYILANAGDDVTNAIHEKLNQVEANKEPTEVKWKELGVSGKRIWALDDTGKIRPYQRGLVEVELPSRFVRLRGQGDKGSIFILPAVDKHPGMTATRALEKRPTVVSLVTPTWPERVSEMEQKFNGSLERLEEAEARNRTLERAVRTHQGIIDDYGEELRRCKELLKHYEVGAVKEGDGALTGILGSAKEGHPLKYRDRYSS